MSDWRNESTCFVLFIGNLTVANLKSYLSQTKRAGRERERESLKRREEEAKRVRP